MIERLGNVFYWTGCAIAALFGFFVLEGLIMHGELIPGAAVAAVFAWLVGRAFRYVLAGRF
ncbi:hypothetical protein CQ14_02995 [Bradyrhizobium lablabi]|uniref:Uncharacterized protein n=1 Tax=Bradyrhizobium lablabi TaxID=722472 RepID=A0A0R3N264_9BRAD|nr:hypothetical protein [Bradyrhizobium lablabi]KRR26468.1 hypothetical protein CQ14_02995 [Bradyrhizobium lablabi]